VKVLIDYQCIPFYLAHGGLDIQVMSTFYALKKIGVDVELSKWWDKSQTADLIHTFTLPGELYLQLTNEKNIPVVCTTLFTGDCNVSRFKTLLKRGLVKTTSALKKFPFFSQLNSFSRWESYNKCSVNIVGLYAEAYLLHNVYEVANEKIHIVPLGVNDVFLNPKALGNKAEHLITIGTITERKGSVELAELAHQAKVPILFVGKPYSEDSDYWKIFTSLIDNKYVKYQSHTDNQEELAKLYANAQGYVLNSDRENWCLAAHEAVACGLPILLPDQPWSRERFSTQAHYFPKTKGSKSEALLSFYKDRTKKPPNIKINSWEEVALELLDVYSKALSKKVK
jgi:glycosyltransferase involved in cell wall biosynthesis